MICLVRHGEAEAGWGTSPDPGLSALGLKQAEAVAEQLASQHPNEADVLIWQGIVLASYARKMEEVSLDLLELLAESRSTQEIDA